MATRKTTTFSMILVMAMLAAPMAWAGPSDDSEREAARVATKQATAAFNLGHYDEAAALYEEAYKHVPDPILLYDIGQSYRQANQPDKALIAYRSYLRTAPDDAPNRAKVKQWVGELEWTSDIQAKTAAQKAAPKTETPAPVVAAPVVTAPVVSAPVVPAPVVPQPPEPQISQQPLPPPWTPARPDLVSQTSTVQEAQPSSSWKKWAPWLGVGITAALGVASIIEGLSARTSFSNLQAGCGQTKTCTDSQVDGVRAKATVTNVLLGLTAASAVATGVVFYFSSGGGETSVSLAWRY
jgi:hypothetical protein